MFARFECGNGVFGVQGVGRGHNDGVNIVPGNKRFQAILVVQAVLTGKAGADSRKVGGIVHGNGFALRHVSEGVDMRTPHFTRADDAHAHTIHGILSSVEKGEQANDSRHIRRLRLAR